MKETIRKFVENGQKTGLMLLDMPTGSGKTYNVLQYICEESLKSENSDRKYFFVTTLKKNLPVEDLRQMFIDRNQEQAFNSKFLFIDSNADAVIENMSLVEGMIPYDIRKMEEFIRLKSEIDIVNSQTSKTRGYNNTALDNELKLFIAKAQEDIRIKLEPAFRHKIEDSIRKLFPTIPQRVKAIETSKEWNWIPKLYPASLTRSKQIIFLSMDKFLARNSTVIEPSYIFANSSIIKNNIIFIDEFDATKETMLKNMINTGLRDSIDYLTLFKNIFSALQMKDFPSPLTTPSFKSLEFPKRWKPEDIIQSFRDKAGYIYDKYNLNYSHKTVKEAEDTRNFLFHDHRFHTIFENGKHYISTYKDDEAKLNHISFVEDIPKNDKSNIQVMLGLIEGFIRWFEKGVFFLAQNYKELKDQETSAVMHEEFSFESSVESVLNLFGLENEYKQFLKNHILSEQRVQTNISYDNAVLKDSTFYQMGFRYFDFINDTSDDMQSQIYMTSMQNTPEKLLLLLIERAKVIGISATATLETVLGNFDLDYIRNCIGKNFYTPPQADIDRMTADFVNSQKRYEDQVDIHKAIVSCDAGNGWMRIFHDDDFAAEAEDIVRSSLPPYLDDKNRKFCIERYMRITTVYREFICKNIQSFLCVLTMHPTDKPSELMLSILNDLFELVNKSVGAGDFNPDCVCRLDGTDYESNKEDITERLGTGEHLFVISVYQTIGAGQNLQYPIPECRNDIVCINDRAHGKYKDYDAIYLEKPTNMLVHFNNMKEQDSFLKYIYQMEYLYEKGEISPYACKQFITTAFKSCLMPKGSKVDNPKTNESPYSCVSYANLGARTILQAIGRICRTNMKSRNIYIYAHEDIRFMLSGIDLSARKYNQEFVELYSEFNKKVIPSPVVSNLEWVDAKTSESADRYVKGFLKGRIWTAETIEQWDDLRKYVLSHPTLSAEEYKESVFKYGYMKLPDKRNSYWYKQERDYASQQIVFDRERSYGCIEVSADNSLLNFLLKQDHIRQFFIRERYATEFKPNEYIMTPTLFNNIYKGALGEIVGEFMLSFFKYKLKRVPDVAFFEYFDYQIDNTPVYIDFKNWKSTTLASNVKQLERIMNKADICKAKGIIIVNIYDAGEHSGSITDRNGIKVLQIPSLLVKGKNGIPETHPKAVTLIRNFINDLNKD